MHNIQNLYKLIPYCNSWNKVDIQLITKGFSDEYKYLIQHLDDDSGNSSIEKVLLRVSDIKKLDDKMVEFNNIKILNGLTNDYIMSRVIEMGTFKDDGYVWVLTTWIEGTDFRDDLLKLTKDQQYQLGLDAGRLLKIFHSSKIQDSSQVYKATIERKLNVLEKYEGMKELRFDKDDLVLKFVRENLDRVYQLNNQNVVLKHGDYHVGNMVLTKDSNQFAIIDFNRCTFGYAIDEFYKIEAFNVELSIDFSVGQIDGYFGCSRDEILNDQLFWYSFKTFVAMSIISGIYWARSFDKAMIDGMTKRALCSCNHFNYFINNIPTWYLDYKNHHKDNNSIL